MWYLSLHQPTQSLKNNSIPWLSLYQHNCAQCISKVCTETVGWWDFWLAENRERDIQLAVRPHTLSVHGLTQRKGHCVGDFLKFCVDCIRVCVALQTGCSGPSLPHDYTVESTEFVWLCRAFILRTPLLRDTIFQQPRYCIQNLYQLLMRFLGS